jgi:hypothetical protein
MATYWTTSPLGYVTGASVKNADEPLRLDDEARLFQHLAGARVGGLFVRVHRAAGRVPPTIVGMLEQHLAGVVEDDRIDAGHEDQVIADARTEVGEVVGDGHLSGSLFPVRRGEG